MFESSARRFCASATTSLPSRGLRSARSTASSRIRWPWRNAGGFWPSIPRCEAFAFYDTAGSVKQLVELCDRHAGAIASEAAAHYYGAQILQTDIEDNPENFTRFFLVRRNQDAVADPESNKLSLAFSLENRPGSLVAALTELSSIGTNLTKIESRPVQGKPWEYIFYVDCQLRSFEERARALEALARHCAMVKELGCYPEARQ